MDLGLNNKRALVCASSKGLGKACALALAREGVNVTLTGRGLETLQAAAVEIRAAAPGVTVTTAVADLCTPEGRSAALAACPTPDILVTNNGGPPPGDFRDWSREDWIRALDMNMLAPIEMMRAVLDSMIERGWGRIVNITSSQVKNPHEVMGLSVGARAGLTGFVAGLSRSVADKGVTINNLLPGPHATERMLAVSARMADATRPKRSGNPDHFGATCAFLCSVQATFITGQNVLVDGGAYPGTF